MIRHQFLDETVRRDQGCDGFFDAAQFVIELAGCRDRRLA